MNKSKAEIGWSNTVEQKTELTDPWMKVVPYGEHPHSKGLQKLDQDSANEMVRHFHSLGGKLKRKFCGVPVYVGHPDDPEFAPKPGHCDNRAFGWIQDLDAREDGLYMLPKWSRAGKRMIQDGYYKYFSPRWNMRSIGNGVFSPNKLISVGMTNTPNILSDAISNTDIEDIESIDTELDQLREENEKLIAQVERFSEIAFEQQQELEKMKHSFGLSASNTPLKTKSITENLASNNTAYQQPNDRFMTLVKHRMSEKGESYTDAWLHAKKTHPELYDQLSN